MASLTIQKWNEIAKRLKGVYTYGNFLQDSEIMKTWYYSLSNYPVEHITQAINVWVSGHRNAPTPADIVDLTKEIGKGDYHRKHQMDGYRMWRLVDKNGIEVVQDTAAPADWDADRVSEWLRSRSVSLSGTILRPIGGDA